MTPIYLLDALEARAKEILEPVRTLKGERFKVYCQNPPQRQDDEDFSIFPFCYISLGDGADNGDGATQDIVFVVCVRDMDPKYQGYRDCANAIQRIRESFTINPDVGDRFTATKPIRWTFPKDEEDFPQYFGAVLITFEIPQQRRESQYT